VAEATLDPGNRRDISRRSSHRLSNACKVTDATDTNH